MMMIELSSRALENIRRHTIEWLLLYYIEAAREYKKEGKDCYSLGSSNIRRHFNMHLHYYSQNISLFSFSISLDTKKEYLQNNTSLTKSFRFLISSPFWKKNIKISTRETVQIANHQTPGSLTSSFSEEKKKKGGTLNMRGDSRNVFFFSLCCCCVRGRDPPTRHTHEKNIQPPILITKNRRLYIWIV